MQQAANFINNKYGEGSIRLDIRDSYFNMRERIGPYFHLVENAVQAFLDLGVEPKIIPIRGGTDGAILSFKGLPCPNLGIGGHNFHSRFEYIPIQSMHKMVEVLIKLVMLYS